MTKTILVIDTDAGFPARLNNNLVDEEIDDQYKVEPLAPDTTLHPAALVDDCVAKAMSFVSSGDVAAIFVDVVVYESGGGPIDHTGIRLAKELRSHLPRTPIFNVTGKGIDLELADILSEATLEDVDGVFIKTFIDGKSFSEGRLKKIMTRANAKRARYRAGGPKVTAAPIPEAARERFGAADLEERIKSQIQEIGQSDFWGLLLKLLPEAEGRLSFTKPGRSGAYVMRARTKFRSVGHSYSRPKGWIIKIARDWGLLQAELKNYKEMIKTPLPRAFYPKPLQDEPIVVGEIAGFAIELEEDAETLMEDFEGLTDEAITRVANGIGRVMIDTYGDASSNKIGKVWREYFMLNEHAKAAAEMFFEENEAILGEMADPRWKDVRAFVQTNGKTHDRIWSLEGEVDRRVIHGDFNSRNILTKNDGQLIIIDFSARRLDHVAKDTAKLERDVMLRIFDGLSANYHDWRRLEIWNDFSLTVKKGSVFSTGTAGGWNADVRKCVDFIYSIRGSVKAISHGLREEDYLCSLLHYTLLGLAHPEMSIQKKVFAVKFVADVLESLS